MLKQKRIDPILNGADDVKADNPLGTMDRFSEGLRRVLAADKKRVPAPRAKRKRKRANIK